MNSPAWQRYLALARSVERVSWALLLLCLPVTSFPYFPKAFGGSALVRPLSLYPLTILLLLAVLPRLLTRPVPRTLLTILPFTLVALASSLLSTLRGIEPTFGVTVTDRLLRALITLGIGGAFYVTSAILPRSEADLRAALRWLYAGFALALAWGSLQAVYVIRFDSHYYKLLSSIQDYISTRKLFTTRVSGLTYEPNWFALQIATLLLPWLLGAVLTGSSVFRWRWKWLSLEWGLLVWSIAVLAFTYSRAGLAIMIVLIFIGGLFLRPARPHTPSAAPKTPPWLRRLLETALVLVLLVAGIYVAGTRSPFFARLWEYWSTVKNTSLEDYIEYVGFGARFVYGEAAYNTYSDHPLLGVGLGNYAFYFAENMPDQPIAVMPELLRIILPDDGRDRLITPKNFTLRLLAETGLLGAAAFTAYLAAILGCVLFLFTARQPETRYWGVSGMLGLIAFAAASLSFDSFAIPNSWVVFGMLTAAAWIYSRPNASPAEPAVPSQTN